MSTEQKSPKPHLSITQLELIAKCPEAYRRAYIEGEKIPPGVAMVRGRAVHSAAEGNFRQKIESHENLKPSDVVAMADAAFTGELSKGGVLLNPEEESRGMRIVTGEARDEVARLARLHAFTQAPDYQPVHVEKAIEVELPNSKRNLKCVIDLIDDKNAVVDLKTTTKTPSQADADQSIQLTAYQLAVTAWTGEPPAELLLDFSINQAETQRRKVFRTRRGPEHIRALGARFAAVSDAIDAGSFPPSAPPSLGAWWCSAKWCGYYRTCPFVAGNGRQND